MVVVAMKQVKLKKIHKNLCSGCDAVISDAIKKSGTILKQNLCISFCC